MGFHVTKLDQLQDTFQSYILSDHNPACMPDITGLPDIYRSAYWCRLCRILSEQFPCLSHCLKQSRLDGLIKQYLQEYPPKHFALTRLVSDFANHLISIDTLTESQKEMARFEGLLREVTLVRRANRMHLEQLSQITAKQWQDLTLSLHPSVRLIECHHDTPRQWQAYHAIAESESSQYWIIWYDQLKSAFQPLTEHEWLLLESIRSEKTFTELCHDATNWFESDQQAIEFVVNSIQGFIQHGFLHSPQA